MPEITDGAAPNPAAWAIGSGPGTATQATVIAANPASREVQRRVLLAKVLVI
ncbi:hypothetical protein MAHJHV64_12730 [Mycobacterium avium subsp. hominissuis]